MFTQNAIQSPAAAYPAVANRRSIDPVSAQVLARYARQEAMIKMLGQLGRAIADIVAGYFRRQRLYRDLSAMPDHLLRDIGLRRVQIAAVAYAGAKRQPADRPTVAAAGKVSVFEPKAAAPAAAAAAKADTPLAA